MTRYVSIGHRLTGWNAVKNRVQQLGLDLTDDQVKEVTAQIKKLADVRTQSIEDVDLLLKQYHRRFSVTDCERSGSMDSGVVVVSNDDEDRNEIEA
jgi:homocitrate synthase